MLITIEACRVKAKVAMLCNSFKGRSHGDFPIFFVKILINLYQSTLLTHELLLYHQGDNIK